MAMSALVASDPADILTAVVEVEREQLRALASGRTVLELGSYYGASTIVMAQVATVVHSVDWHRGDDFAGEAATLVEFFANLDRYGVRDRVVAHVGRFEDVVPMLQPVFDMAFLDGAHSYEDTRDQARLARSVLHPGSLMAFHDYGSGFEGVKQAVDEIGPVQVVRTLAWLTV